MHIGCLLWGHDDRQHHSPDRLFLRCEICGRETAGWALDFPRPRYLFPLYTRRLRRPGNPAARASATAALARIGGPRAVLRGCDGPSHWPHPGGIGEWGRPPAEIPAPANVVVGAEAVGERAERA